MKKLISLALCLTVALAFAAGCKKQEEAPKPVETPKAAAPAPAQAPMSSAKAAPAAPTATPAAPEKK